MPTVNAETVTPHAEAFQAVVWHLLVSHPLLKVAQTEVGIDALDSDTLPHRMLEPPFEKPPT